MLADELNNEDKLASQYFDIDQDDFDLETFDIYAEIGASNTLFARVIRSLTESIEQRNSASDEEHILLTSEVRPALLGKADRS